MEELFRYNHQNAWSKLELTELLTKHGFEVKPDFVPNMKVLKKKIPDIDAMSSFSMFLFARKHSGVDPVSL